MTNFNREKKALPTYLIFKVEKKMKSEENGTMEKRIK